MEKAVKDNVIAFSDDEMRLLDIAADRRERGDLFGALSTLSGLRERGCKIPELYAEFGYVYTELDLYELSIHNWLRFLTRTPASSAARAYSAIGANYYFRGNYIAAVYYFEQRVKADPNGSQEYDDYMIDCFETMNDRPKYPGDIRICYPESAVSAKTRMSEGQFLMMCRKFEEAEEKFAMVKETSKLYPQAVLKRANCAFNMKRYDDALDILDEEIERDPNDLDAIIEAINFCYEIDRKSQAGKYFDFIEKIASKDPDECMKIAQIYCRAENFLRAEKYLRIVLADDPYDLPALFLFGLASYNIGEYERARKCFLKCYLATSRPDAKYLTHISAEAAKNRKKQRKLTYQTSFPYDVVTDWMDAIESIVDGGKRAIKRLDVEKIIDYTEGILLTESEISAKVVKTLLQSGNLRLRNYIVDKLLSPELEDEFKVFIVESLILYTPVKNVSLLFGFIFTKVPLYRVDFEKNRVFECAYAMAYGRCAPFDPKQAHKIRDEAITLYYRMKDDGKLRLFSDVEALAAAIVIRSGVGAGSNKGMLAKYLGISRNRINAVLKIIEEE